MSAGQLGGGTFAYLKPIDFCDASGKAFKGIDEELQPLLGQWIDCFELTGLHKIGYLNISTTSYVSDVVMRLDVDGVIHDFSLSVGYSNAIISKTNATNDGALDELIFKDYCKVSIKIGGSAGGSSSNTNREVNYVCRYVPAVVESVS